MICMHSGEQNRQNGLENQMISKLCLENRNFFQTAWIAVQLASWQLRLNSLKTSVCLSGGQSVRHTYFYYVPIIYRICHLGICLRIPLQTSLWFLRLISEGLWQLFLKVAMNIQNIFWKFTLTDLSPWFSEVEYWIKLWYKQMAGVKLGGISRFNIGIIWGHRWMTLLGKTCVHSLVNGVRSTGTSFLVNVLKSMATAVRTLSEATKKMKLHHYE